MENKYNSGLLEKLNKYDALTIETYMNFWGFKRIEFICDSPEINAFIEKTEKATLSHENTYNLVVTNEYKEDEGNTVFIPFSQLIYDLNVFYTIPGEIKDRVRIERFGRFTDKVFNRMKNNGWQICFSNNSIYTKELKNYTDVLIINDEFFPDTKKVLLIQCWNSDKANLFYEANKSICLVDIHFALVLIREWLIIEICDYFKTILSKKGVKLYLVNWEWAQNNPLFPQKEITSLDKEKRREYTVYNISGQEDKYEDYLKQLYGQDFSYDYVKNVMDIPLRNYYGAGSIHHADKSSEFLNVSFGERKTTDQPAKYRNNIYMLGGCVFFGYAIDDSKTISSYLQRKINESNTNSYRVSNYAVWGGNIDETYNTFYELEYKKGDIVLISYAGLIPIGDFDISTGLSNCITDKEFYYDAVPHCNAFGYEKVADTVFSFLEEDICNPENSKESFRLLRNKEFVKNDKRYEEELNNYLKTIGDMLPQLHQKDKSYGCAVMNCNPFTLGHRYLIESSSKKVDYLIIFVVEENKSYFDFNDRIELVKKGVSDLKNVYVVPSGKLMISAVTFPGYFLKDNPKESVADSSKDVEIFGRYIAPKLGISRRFVGEEPTDFITNQYNETMINILPRYGIELTVIPRKKSKEDIISASTVRKLLEQKRFEDIKRFVPATTYEYLLKRFNK